MGMFMLTRMTQRAFVHIALKTEIVLCKHLFYSQCSLFFSLSAMSISVISACRE